MQRQTDHPITIEPNPNRVRVLFDGRVVADTTRALTLREASLPAVQYIPREDADMSLLERTAHQTHCPYKSDAAYYTIRAGERPRTPSGATRIDGTLGRSTCLQRAGRAACRCGPARTSRRGRRFLSFAVQRR